MTRLTTSMARRFGPGRVALVLLAPVAVFAVMGAIQRLADDGGSLRWNLDSEAAYATGFSSALLGVAALGGFLAYRAGTAGHWGLVFAAVLGFAAIDDGSAIHERLERALALDWQVLYAPLLAFGAVALAMVVRESRDGATRRWYVAGGAAWATALVLEAVAWWGGDAAAAYDPMMVGEEVLEMVGAACFVVAPLAAVRAADALRGRARPGPPASA